MLSREADVEAHALREQGWTISAIARHLGHDRKTVRAYMSGARVPEVRVRREPTLAEPFLEYCRLRLAEDPHLWASTLFDELAGLGFPGSYPSLTAAIRAHELRPHCEPCQASKGRDSTWLEGSMMQQTDRSRAGQLPSLHLIFARKQPRPGPKQVQPANHLATQAQRLRAGRELMGEHHQEPTLRSAKVHQAEGMLMASVAAVPGVGAAYGDVTVLSACPTSRGTRKRPPRRARMGQPSRSRPLTCSRSAPTRCRCSAGRSTCTWSSTSRRRRSGSSPPHRTPPPP